MIVCSLEVLAWRAALVCEAAINALFLRAKRRLCAQRAWIASLERRKRRAEAWEAWQADEAERLRQGYRPVVYRRDWIPA